MPLHLDARHRLDGLTVGGVREGHRTDIEIQYIYGVAYRQNWFDDGTGTAFCLAEALDKGSTELLHREAVDLTADEITEVAK